MNQHLTATKSVNVPELKTVHTFCLRPLKADGGSSVSIEADFSPRKDSESSSVSTLPSFNSDGKHFTPAFCLSSEVGSEEHWEQNFFRNFENKKNQCTDENKGLYLPKPESRYCQVCHEYFEDYLKHTKHPVHIKKLRQGSMEAQIQNLIQYFKTSEKKSPKRLNTVEEKNSSDSFEEGFGPKKKLKTQIQSKDQFSTVSTMGSLNHLMIPEGNSLSQLEA